MNEDFLFQVYAAVCEIPEGCVATYGQIADLIGHEKNSRAVGKTLSMAGMYGDFPCHRVVSSSGRLTPGWDEQYELLLNEGVSFKSNGNVDLAKSKWHI